MRPSCLLTRVLVLCAMALGSNHAQAQGRAWIVSKDACSQADFAQVQAAIDAAADGDTIFVRPIALGDVYDPFTLQGKSLSVIGTPPLNPTEHVAICAILVRDLTAGQSVVLEGLGPTKSLEILSNQGPVWVEACSVDSDTGPGVFSDCLPLVQTSLKGRPGARVEDCQSVAFLRCRIEGLGALTPFNPPGGFGILGGAGLEAVSSNIQAYDTEFFGGIGATGYGFTPVTKGGDGGQGVRLENSALFASGCFIWGGRGGETENGTFSSGAGNGGTGLEIADLLSSATTLDTPVAGGLGGFDFFFLFDPLLDGTVGIPVTGPGRASHQILAGNARSFSMVRPGPVRETEGFSLELRGDPGDIAFVGFSGVQAHDPFLPFFGTDLLGASIYLFAGVLPASGFRLRSFPLNSSLVTATQSIQLYSQGYFFDPVNLHIGPADAFQGVDSSQDSLFGCTTGVTLWVDDDGMFDPGPGDPNLSDPMEDGSQLHPFDSIQEAIDAAIVGTTPGILLEDGAYTGAGNTSIDMLGKPLLLRSRHGAAVCSIEDGTNAFVFQNAEGAASVVSGITFRGHTGRAILCQNGSPTIEDCEFLDNTGGAIEIVVGSPGISGCNFLGNSTLKGGAIRTADDLDVQDCDFQFNQSVESGGAVFSSGDLTLTRCVFLQNSAGSTGGAVHEEYQDPTPGSLKMAIMNCEFDGNQSELAGGALFSYWTSADVSNSVFLGNTSNQEQGGAIGSENSSYAVVYSTFAYNSGYCLSTESTASFLSNSFTHSIVWGNTSTSGGQFRFTGAVPIAFFVEFCDVQGGVSSVEDNGGVLSFSSSIDADPLFVSSSDLHLTPFSPCVDLTIPQFTVDDELAFDIDGQPRIMGTSLDYGSDEL